MNFFFFFFGVYAFATVVNIKLTTKGWFATTMEKEALTTTEATESTASNQTQGKRDFFI